MPESDMRTYNANVVKCVLIQQGQTATEYEVTVVVQELIGAIQVTDKFYSVVCDTDNLDTGYIDVNAVDVA